MAVSRLLTKNFDADFKTKKKANIFDYNEIKDLMDDYWASAGNIMEACKDAYQEAGEFIVEEAAKRCPIDTETMERAMIMIPGGRARSSYDKFTLYIGFDPGIPYPAWRYKDGRTTGDVFTRIHEMMWPEGDFTFPSKVSQAKGAIYGVTVGGGFLRRAIDENQDEIRDIIKTSVQKSIAEMNVAKKKYRYKPKRGEGKYRVGVDDDF